MGEIKLKPASWMRRVRLGGLLDLYAAWRPGQSFRFQFNRPEAGDSAHYLFWGPLEVIWEGPKSLRRYGLAS
jgi:hypothetical protein